MYYFLDEFMKKAKIIHGDFETNVQESQKKTRATLRGISCRTHRRFLQKTGYLKY